MNCNICENPLFPERAVFRCSCGAYTHAYCWEKHILESHRPPFVVGTITIDGEFRANKPEIREGSHPTANEAVALERKYEVSDSW